MSQQNPTGDPMVKCPKCGNITYLFVSDKGPQPTHCSKCKEPFNLTATEYNPLTTSPEDEHHVEEWLKSLEEINHQHQTLVVNLLGGPGCGKSTIRAGVFYELKLKGIQCEEAAEFAKDLTWSQNRVDLNNQIHVFGEQHHRIWRLLGQVEVVITDSPLLLTPIYDLRQRKTLNQLVLEEYNAMWNYTVLLTRCKPYNTIGRSQTEEEAKVTDMRIADYLLDNRLPFESASGNEAGKDKIVRQILKLLNK